MVPVAADTLSAEQSWETTAFRNHILGNAYLILWFRFTDNEFADLRIYVSQKKRPFTQCNLSKRMVLT